MLLRSSHADPTTCDVLGWRSASAANCWQGSTRIIPQRRESLTPHVKHAQAEVVHRASALSKNFMCSPSPRARGAEYPPFYAADRTPRRLRSCSPARLRVATSPPRAKNVRNRDVDRKHERSSSINRPAMPPGGNARPRCVVLSAHPGAWTRASRRLDVPRHVCNAAGGGTDAMPSHRFTTRAMSTTRTAPPARSRIATPSGSSLFET